MGSSFSLQEAAISKIRDFNESRKVSFEEYLEHITGTHGADVHRIFPMYLMTAKYLLVRRLSLAFHAIPSVPGELPYYLPHLQLLDLSHNCLQSLPGNFGHLFHLQTLLLSHNKLKALPTSMAEMTDLTRIDISHNAFDDFPEVLTKVASLEQIGVAFNRLSALPASLLCLEHLDTLYCVMNRCAAPPQEVCDKGAKAILAFLSAAPGRSESSSATGRQEHGPSPAIGTKSAALRFNRVSCPVEAAALVKKLTPNSDSPTLSERQKTPLRVPKEATALSGDELVDRIAGLVYGAALGDAVGLATEFMTRQESQFHYGVHGERLAYESVVHDRHRCKWTSGDWTDDTDQMILILLSLIHWGGVVDEVDFAARLRHWCDNGFEQLGDKMGLGIGNTVATAVSNPDFLTSPHEVARKIWEGTDNAANGAIMRTAILGVPHFHDLDIVKENAVRICKTTHFDPRCQASCVAVCSAVALILQGKHDLGDANQMEKLLGEAARLGRELLSDQRHLEDFDRYTSAADFEGLACDKMREIGYTLKPLGAAWAAMRQGDNFKDVMTSLVMQGGDADTNAAVAGAVLGCRLGYSRLPVDWMSGLLQPNVEWLDKKVNAFLDLIAV